MSATVGAVIDSENGWRELLDLPKGTILIERGGREDGRACQIWGYDNTGVVLTYADSDENMWQSRAHDRARHGEFVGSKPAGKLIVVWIPS